MLGEQAFAFYLPAKNECSRLLYRPADSFLSVCIAYTCTELLVFAARESSAVCTMTRQGSPG
jgi:hypothetical protein